MHRPTLAALLAAAVFAAPAAAESVSYKRFRSPTGKIDCYAVQSGGNGIECFADYLPELGRLDSYLGLEARGKSRYAERGDFAGFPDAKTRTLAYGDTWKRNGVTCRMRDSGLTCRNLDDHGFKLAQGDIRRF